MLDLGVNALENSILSIPILQKYCNLNDDLFLCVGRMHAPIDFPTEILVTGKTAAGDVESGQHTRQHVARQHTASNVAHV